MDKSKLIESLKWRMEMFAHDIDVIEEERKGGGIGNRYLSGRSVAYTEAFEYLEGLVEDIENGEYDKTGHWIFDDECKEHGHCSKCGYGSVDLVDGEPHNFCRKCGCRMVGSQESEGKE